MNIVLSVYSPNAFCEILLPAENNADKDIVLEKNVFAFAEDVILKLEVVEKRWYIRPSDSYIVTQQNSEDTSGQLLDKNIYTIRESHGSEISVIVRETEDSFSVFDKYDLSSVQMLSIGKDADNQIVYQFQALVSRRHAVLHRKGGDFVLEDVSANGTFVNGKRVYGNYTLKIGDIINIFGLKIVFLGDLIAVNAPKENTCEVKDSLPGYSYKNQETRKGDVIKTPVKYFHRAPRNYTKLETDTIEIEAPPSPKEQGKKPLWMIIGPSFTMMIPMLAGSVIAIMSARSSGRDTGIYMYTGIITAVGSAVIGVFWALANLRYSKKEILNGEQERFRAYGEYLIKRAEFIREKYDRSRTSLLAMYPAALVVADYDDNNAELWNKNRKHADFLHQRLGIGNMPFQMAINVPKERFTMISDELSGKPRMIKEEYSTLYDVPINIDLLKHKLVGVVGGNKKKGAFDVIRLLTAQIAANNCYTDVKLAFLYDENKDEEDWNYARWLPHVWSEDKKSRYVASNKTEASDVLFELTQILRMRDEDEGMRKETLPKPYYILIVSDVELLEGELISKYIYKNDPCYGLATLILAESQEQLPNECEYLIENDSEFKGLYDLAEDTRQPLVFDGISAREIELFARKLIRIEVKEVEKGRDIPDSISFLDMHNVGRLEELLIAEKWRKNRTYENMRAQIGAKAGGAPCYLDVHEKYHGPHGLVAGTTGSGKSETLQTYMLSLAINFSPDDIGYFIIDYKGGGMAGLFDGLPHMIGSISNLSGNQVRRAMLSIKSENKRRQRIFTENNVNNINLYTKLYKNGEASVPIPHMFIIIDEFAELKREEPEFMKELISVAQVGRSLGVHLILATQKPSGTVDDNIWSNAKFRLCLRVQDRQDSNDMLHKPDAAYITQAGRGYLQVGNDEVYELFQSGYSGAVYDEDSEVVRTEIASMLSLTGKAALVGNSLKSKQLEKNKISWIHKLLEVMRESANVVGGDILVYAEDPDRIKMFFEKANDMGLEYSYSEYNARRIEDMIQIVKGVILENGLADLDETAQAVIRAADSLRKKLPEMRSKTQLDAVIEYLGKVAKEEGYAEQMQLWMPLLPQVMYLKDIKDNDAFVYYDGTRTQLQGKWNLSVDVGLCDDPVNQAQMPLTVDFSTGGHLAVCGSVVSGKSTFIQTLIYAIICKYHPDWVNIYAIDFSSHMLGCFKPAPHVGDVMYEDDNEKIDKFFYMIEGVIEERRKTFSGGNYAQYVQAKGVVIPAIIIALDNISSFREKTENRYDDKLIQLAKEGVGYGIFLAVTAAGFATSEIPSKMGDNIKTVVCLQMNDKFGYSDALRNSQIEVLPENNVKGRGLALVGENILEFQTALALEADDDFNRNESIKDSCTAMAKGWNGHHARNIPVIPEKPVWSEFEQLECVKELQESPYYLPIGYDMGSADIYGIDLRKTYSYLISGRARTGKTNLMKAVIRSAASKRGHLIVIEHGSADLKVISHAAGAEYIDTQAAQADFFGRIMDPFIQRNTKKHTLLELGKDEAEIFEEMKEEKPYFIIVSDIVKFVQSVVKPEEGITKIQGFVENIAEKGKLHNVFFFIGINPDTVSSVLGLKLYEDFVGYHTGIHLGGSANNIRYMDFSNVSFVEQSKAQKAGIGMIPLGNEDDTAKVVIPHVRG